MQTAQLCQLLALLLLPTGSQQSDFCGPAAGGQGGYGLPDSLCSTPYCSCNHPYGRVYCSCTPTNSTIPQASQVTIKSTGTCSLPSETRDLEITGCVNVTFVQDAFEALRNLRTVQVSNVKEIVLDKHSFNWNRTTAGLVVLITNTTIVNLPSFTFSGYISKVVFRNVYLGLIKAFAFSSITDTERIQFGDCDFANVEPQSFKKFTTAEFHIENSRFHIIPSRFLHELHVHKTFRLHSNSINIARTLAFHVHNPTDTFITQNRVNVLEGESLSVQAKGPVTIRDNIFETVEPAAFKGILVDRHKSSVMPLDLVFDNNTLSSFTEASLYFNRPDFQVHFTSIHFDEVCTCDRLEQWSKLVFPPKNNFPTPVEAHLKELWCHLDSKKEVDFDYVRGETYYGDNCTALISSLFFFVIVIVSAVLGLCVLIVVALVLIRRKREWDPVATTEDKNVTLKVGKDPKKGLVVPDGRVYRETEFHVIVEKVEPMEEAVPFHVTRDRSRSYIREAPS